MEIIKTTISDVIIINPSVYGDERGYFFESWNQKTLKTLGFDHNFVQDNQSLSMKGVLRGMHFQNPPYAQGKLVRVIQGAIWDVAVDLRKDSPTFLQYVAAELTAENKHMFYIPEGFAHGFLTLLDNTIVCYKCTMPYHKESEITVKWNDPQMNIQWPETNPILSDRDKSARQLSEIVIPF